MAIVIKDMEMPEHCAECPCFDLLAHWGYCRILDVKHPIYRIDFDREKMYECPLEEEE